ncbi:pre-toxin TG domain-containing protein [Sinorhizobium fredii]|uniref:pre-toxin TG domain-containing protein n=1 Tax=Rhizobium fredii TaxID=380 RepID=UPI0035190463
MLRWVQRNAATASENLARADYDVRTLNYFVRTLDFEHSRIAQAASDLDRTATEIDNSERTMPGDDIAASVRRDQHGGQLLNTLTETRARLDWAKYALAKLKTVDGEAQFHAAGLSQVGRATLLASVVELGNSRAATFQGRYSVYVSISTDESGNVKSGRVQTGDGDWVDAALSLAGNIHWGFWVVEAFYQYGKYIVAAEECEKRIKTQKERLEDAYKQLPAKLMSPSKLYQIYRSTYDDKLQTFGKDIDNVDKALSALDARWKELAAFNALRTKLSSTVLTAEKVRELQNKYERGAAADIFDNIFVTQIAEGLGSVRSALSTGERAVLNSCADAQGFRAYEDFFDSLAYAQAEIDAIGLKGSTAPLLKLISDTRSRITLSLVERDQYLRALRGRGCGGENLRAAQIPNGMPRFPEQEMKFFQPMRFGDGAGDNSYGPRLFAAYGAALQLSLFCSLSTRDNENYTCDGGGTLYSDQFNEGTNDPRTNILLNPADGGYRQDVHSPGLTAAEIQANIDARLNSLYAKSGGVERALPEWIKTNEAFLSGATQHAQEQLAATQTQRFEFVKSNEGLRGAASEAIADFVKSPTDEGMYGKLIAELGGIDPTLPQLPQSQITPDFPEIPGLAAKDSAYDGTPAGTARDVLREQRKSREALADNTDAANLSASETALARRFADSGSERGVEIGKSLVVDAASVRFHEKGLLPAPSLTTVGAEGALGRVNQVAGDLPTSSVLFRAGEFDLGLDAFKQKRVAAGEALDREAPDFAQREQLISFSGSLAGQAEQTFYQGDLDAGELLLKFANLTLEGVTRFTPGINVARDVYEAVSGKDLLTGQELTNLERAGAILGVVTIGLSTDVIGGIRIISKIAKMGESAEKAERILEAAKTIKGGAVELSEHALERMAQRGISEDRLEDAIDWGSRAWDRRQGSLMAIEREAVKGQARVAAAIDIDKNSVSTVMWWRQADAEELFEGQLRYIELPEPWTY